MLGPLVHRLFPRDGGREPDWQRRAAELASVRRLLLLAGGPGTGKTFTVARVIGLLDEHALAIRRPRPRVLLLAPTGKAAARLDEAVREARAPSAPLPVTRAATIHRALGYGGRGRWRHDAEDPLRADLVIVDEASMVDIALMHRLLEAVPPAARLLLVGDPYQLASVEAGAVFGDLVGPETEPAIRTSSRIESRRSSENPCRAPDEPGATSPIASSGSSTVTASPPRAASAPSPRPSDPVTPSEHSRASVERAGASSCTSSRRVRASSEPHSRRW